MSALETDYTSPTSLTSTLKSTPTPPNQTALIILINRDRPDPQIALLNAASEAGIAHVLPSSFGFGKLDNEYLRTFPPLFGKNKMENHVAHLGSKGKLSYTCIQTGAFLDWILDRGLFANLINAEAPFGGKGATLLFDGGEARFSATMLEDIGKAVVGVLREPAAFRNRHVHVHSVVTSQNQLLGFARKLAPEREFPVVPVDTAQAEQAGRAKFEAGESGPEVMAMFMPRPTFGLGLGLFEEVDNKKLGIKVYGEADLMNLVAEYLKR